MKMKFSDALNQAEEETPEKKETPQQQTEEHKHIASVVIHLNTGRYVCRCLQVIYVPEQNIWISADDTVTE